MIRRFNRYELKYLLPLPQAKRLMEELKQTMHPDPHGGRAGYPIVSLYYDSDDLSCFWAKVEGIRYRRKLRLRIYPAQDIAQTPMGMVEIKQRSNRTVQKRRLALPLDAARKLCRGDYDAEALAALSPLDREVASEVLYLVNAQHLKPAAITAYHRIAFVGNAYESGLRVTFDLDLRGRLHALDVAQSAVNRRILGSRWCVMEVKSDDKIPDWVTSLLARHGCQTQRISKYCAVVSQCTPQALPANVTARTRLPDDAAARLTPVPASPSPAHVAAPHPTSRPHGRNR